MVAIGGEKLSYLITTLIVDRPRPEVETIGKVHVTSSFPSGHVASAVSLYAGVTMLVLVLAAGQLHRQHVWTGVAVGVIFTAIVGYSRMYRGHHFLTDVITGMFIGAAWIVIAYRYVLRPYLDDQRKESPDDAASRWDGVHRRADVSSGQGAVGRSRPLSPTDARSTSSPDGAARRRG
jgi:undecaprenyl-diphosphatase